ncbi:hypothetical protein D3C72_2107380 [compost metagenome]
MMGLVRSAMRARSASEKSFTCKPRFFSSASALLSFSRFRRRSNSLASSAAALISFFSSALILSQVFLLISRMKGLYTWRVRLMYFWTSSNFDASISALGFSWASTARVSSAE